MKTGSCLIRFKNLIKQEPVKTLVGDSAPSAFLILNSLDLVSH